MYNEEEEYEQKGFPFRDFLLKLILIILFVFLLIWLLPKFITPKVVDGNGEIVDLSPLTSQIFADNLDRMKEAAISYYTNERLPQEVGESDKMTLSDMIGKHIIQPLIDKNNKACDVEKSYVKITKLDEEYILKVNLKDSEKEDYILVHLGCYDYCDSYVCEKEDGFVKGDGGEEIFTPKPTVTPTETTSPKPTITPTETTSPTPTVTPTETTSPTPTETVSPKPSPTTDPTPKPKTEYEYSKTTNANFSNWTEWSFSYVDNKPVKISCKTQPTVCKKDDEKCLEEIKVYKREEIVGNYETIDIKKESITHKATYNKKTCSNYNYVIIDNKTYVTNKNIKYTTATVSKDGWIYKGRGSYKIPPKDTETEQYVFAGADYSHCNGYCETTPNYFYDKYVYNSSLSSVTNTQSTPGHTTVEGDTTVTADCGSYVYEEVPVYRTITETKTVYKNAPISATVCYKRSRKRKLLSPSTIDFRWSHYGNYDLLNNGWEYTGNTRKFK